MGSNPYENVQDKIIVALDVENEGKAIELIERFENKISFVKVGMEVFYGNGYSLIEKLKKRNLKIFLDLKMHDIPNTVGKATAQLTRLEVDMFNLHIAGGLKMMEEARNQMEKALYAGQKRPLIIGVTQLTSTDERMLHQEIGINSSIEDSVIHYAKLGKMARLDGVVSSALEANKIKEFCGKDFLLVTPGIRLQDNQNDQKRVTTPREAILLGSDYLVIGRTITNANNPASAIDNVIKNIKGEGVL